MTTKDTMMNCERFQAMLPDHLDDGVELPAEARQHLSGCDDCRRVLAELHAIRHQARELAPLAPSRDLWSGISDRIEARVVPLSTAERPRWRRQISLRVAGVAAAALVVASSALTYTMSHRTEVTPIALTPPVEPGITVVANEQKPTQYDREIVSLRAVLDSGRGRLDPATVAILERNLTIIDSAIAQCRSALQKDPSSQFLMQSLSSAYQNKVRLLRVAAQATKG